MQEEKGENARKYSHASRPQAGIQLLIYPHSRPVRICRGYRSETSNSEVEVQQLTVYLWTAVGDLVKTTLGPKGMDKILQSAYVSTLVVRKMSSDN